LQIAPEQQYLVAQSMERYANAIGEKVFNYLAVAVSIEDPGTLVLIMGYPDKETAEFADKVSRAGYVVVLVELILIVIAERAAY